MNMLYDSESFVVMHFQADAAPETLPAAADGAGQLHAPVFRTGDVSMPAEGRAGVAPRLARHGFEIVDKRCGKEIYLDGSWAELFQQQIVAWQLNTPTQEEVEDTLDRYAALAHQPVVVH